MQKIAIVTDSHSSIPPAEAALLGVHVLPMPFEVDGQDYFEGVNLSRQQFFGYQRAGAVIGTSQPAPGDVMELWDRLLTDHDAILYMPISSGLSHSCQTALALAEEEPYAGRVFVVDNGRVTYTFTIANTGNTPVVATDNAVITDTFDPILTDLVVTFNGVTWVEGVDYTYNPATGQFSTVAGNVTVPAATYVQDPVTGIYAVTPGISTLVVTGTI